MGDEMPLKVCTVPQFMTSDSSDILDIIARKSNAPAVTWHRSTGEQM